MRGDSAISSKVSQWQLVLKTQEYYFVVISLCARYCTYHAMHIHVHARTVDKEGPGSCAELKRRGESAISSKVSQWQLVVKTQEYYFVIFRLRALLYLPRDVHIHVHARTVDKEGPGAVLELERREESAISSKVSQWQLVVKIQEYYFVIIRLRMCLCKAFSMCV